MYLKNLHLCFTEFPVKQNISQEEPSMLSARNQLGKYQTMKYRIHGVTLMADILIESNLR